MGEQEKKANNEINILLIDDDVDFLQLMSEWFQSKGYAITTANNGEDGLKRIRENSPDIIFLDVILSDTDGYMVLKQIRRLSSTVPVIMMSSYIRDTRIEKKVDFVDFFFKGDDFTKAHFLLEEALKNIKK